MSADPINLDLCHCGSLSPFLSPASGASKAYTLESSQRPSLAAKYREHVAIGIRKNRSPRIWCDLRWIPEKRATLFRTATVARQTRSLPERQSPWIGARLYGPAQSFT
jgi:hypothetical protein